MTNPTSYTDEQVREAWLKGLKFDRPADWSIAKMGWDAAMAYLDADRQRLQAEVEALRAALEVEMVDLDFTTQAVVGGDPKSELLLRLGDQKRRVSAAINARATPNETKETGHGDDA